MLIKDLYWGVEGIDDLPFVVPLIPAHFVNDTDSALEIKLRPLPRNCFTTSTKQGEYYGLIGQLDEEINRRLKILGWHQFSPRKQHALEGNILGFLDKYSIYYDHMLMLNV